MTERSILGGSEAGNRLGCALVVLPFAAFLIVLPDAVHIWPQPWSNPLLWLIGSVAIWLVLRWLIDKPVSQVGRRQRLVIYGLLLAVSATSAAQIVRSFYEPNGYVRSVNSQDG